MKLDKLLHEPARLAIMTALASCEQASFLYLMRLIGLSKGNLSGHLAKLESSGLLSIDKKFVGRKPQTMVAITPQGEKSIEAYWQHLDSLRQATKHIRLNPNDI